MSQFGNNIKTRRIERKMTQDELAKILSVSRTSISNWETGKNYPDFTLLVDISNALNISLDVLIKEDYELMKHVAYNEKLSKRRKKLLFVLTPVVLVLSVFFIINVFDLNISDIKKEDIESVKIVDHNLILKIDINEFETITAWVKGNGTEGEVDLTVSKEFSIKNYFKKNKDNKVTIPLDENDLKTNEILLTNTGEIIEF